MRVEVVSDPVGLAGLAIDLLGLLRQSRPAVLVLREKAAVLGQVSAIGSATWPWLSFGEP